MSSAPARNLSTSGNNRRRVDFYILDEVTSEGVRAFEVALTISATTTDPDASCAAYASAITMIFPDFVDDLKDIMRQHGIEPVDVFLPSQAALKSIQMPTGSPLCWTEIVVLFGAGLFLLFKNLNAASFDKFMSARLKALKSVVGCIKNLPNPFTLNQAKNVGRVFGSDRNLKKSMVETFIDFSDRSDLIGSCCRYLMHILEWSGMQLFKCMHERFFVCPSAVVDDPKLEREVAAAREAIDKVMKLTHPPFFRFLAPVEEQHLLGNSRFPTLITVAAVIMPDYCGSVFNSTTPIDVNDPEIQRLVGIHRRSMRNIVPLDLDQSFFFESY